MEYVGGTHLSIYRIPYDGKAPVIADQLEERRGTSPGMCPQQANWLRNNNLATKISTFHVQ
jgi:hypothetical protein